MILQRELRKMGVDLNDNRDIFPSGELPKIADRLGIRFYGPGEQYYLPENTPVVAIIHEDGNDVDIVQYGIIKELATSNIVGLFVRE